MTTDSAAEFAANTHHISINSADQIVKTFRSAERNEPYREWSALHLLQKYAPGIAPIPISADLTGDSPSITMSQLPGQPLADVECGPEQLQQVLIVLDHVHRCVPADVVAAMDRRINHPAIALHHVRTGFGRIAGRLSEPTAATALVHIRQWLASADAEKLATAATVECFGRADHNLSNFLWDGERIRLIDFEDSGRSDIAAELADLVEHLSSRVISDSTWDTLIAAQSFTVSERIRFRQARRLQAAFWFLLLLPGGSAASRNPPGTLTQQAERILSLL